MIEIIVVVIVGSRGPVPPFFWNTCAIGFRSLGFFAQSRA